MDTHGKVLRMGAAALVCALVFRLASRGLPEKIAAWFSQPEAAAFLIYLETGRDVRFSLSSQVFSPEFAAASEREISVLPEVLAFHVPKLSSKVSFTSSTGSAANAVSGTEESTIAVQRVPASILFHFFILPPHIRI